MENKYIYILGVGNNTIVTIDLAESCGYHVKGLYHFEEGRTGESYYGHVIEGTHSDLFSQDLSGKNFAISVGDNKIRGNLYLELKKRNGRVVTLIHPSAVVSKYAKIGEGCCIHAQSVVCAGVNIGENCVVSFNATIIHGARMKDHCFVAAAALVGANTVMEEYSFLGLNATVISNKVNRIGENVVVGAGSVVTKEVQDNVVVAGVPAKLVRQNQKDNLH